MNSKKEEIENLINLSQFHDAKIMIEHYLEHEPFDQEIAIYQATVQINEGQKEEAADTILKGLSCNSDNYELYFMLGNVLEDKNLKQAAICYQQAVACCTEKADLDQIKEYTQTFLSNTECNIPDTLIFLIADEDKQRVELCKEVVEQNAKLPFKLIILNSDKEGEINNVIPTIHQYSDILFLKAQVMLLHNVLFLLKMALYSEERIGATAPVFNRGGQYGQLHRFNGDDPITYAHNHNYLRYNYREAIRFNNNAVLFKREVLSKFGGLDCTFVHLDTIMEDAAFNILKNSYRNIVCEDAFAYDLDSVKHVNNTLDEKKLNAKWGMKYCIAIPNYDLLELVKEPRDKELNILEVGCNCGENLLELKRSYHNAHMYGIEINKNAGEMACNFGNIIVDNIENMDLPYEHKFFDYIIFGDVLEHLRNPQDILKYIKCFLKDRGSIIASIPNIAHISVIQELLYDNFTYTDTGLLDSTHIHFFTKNEIIKTFDKCEYEIDIMEGVYSSSVEYEYFINKLTRTFPEIDGDRFRNFQYRVKASHKRSRRN